jgi:hypothetical protein
MKRMHTLPLLLTAVLRLNKRSRAPRIAACGLLLAGCSTPHHASKWEYRHAQTLAEVNQLAEQGWTVVTFAMPESGPWQYLLKRPNP